MGSIFLALLGNRSTWIVLAIAIAVGGVWFKISSLKSDLMQAEKELSQQKDDILALKGNNNLLKQNLDLAISVNEQNSQLVETIRRDQETATASLQKLATDLSRARVTLTEAKRKLANNTTPGSPVPQNIVDAIVTIQQSRVEQAAINKKLEAEK